MAALEGWQKTEQANRRVLQQLEARVAGKRVPTLVLDLFATGWRNYLIRVMLRQGAGSEAEAEAWQVVDNLLAWLDPERGGQPAYQDVQHLLKTVDARLKLVCADRDSQDRLLERLTDVLLKQGEAAYRSVAGILPGQPESTGEAAPDEDDLLDSFRVGDWVSFDGMPVPLNLILIGDDPESYVFCNYKGVTKLELARDEFVQRIASSPAKLADNLDLPLMESSFSSMIQRIHQNLLKQATVDEKTGLVERREFMRRAHGSLLHPARAGADGAICRQVMGVLDVENLRVLRSGIDAFEINISCPNVKEGGVGFGTSVPMTAEITRRLRSLTKKALIMKLTPNVTHVAEFARAAAGEGADAVSLINTLIGMAVDIRTRKPRLATVTGGLSGPAIKPVALAKVYEVAQAVKIPIVGIGGITSAEDAIELPAGRSDGDPGGDNEFRGCIHRCEDRGRDDRICEASKHRPSARL